LRHPTSRLCAAALAVCLAAGAQARAFFGFGSPPELITWKYNWVPSTTQILADNPAQGAILLSNEPFGTAVTTRTGAVVSVPEIIASNITTASTADPSHPATFTNKPYSLSVLLLDELSGKTGTLTFSGVFNGTLSTKSAIISNTLTSPLSQSVRLGDHLYRVDLLPFKIFDPPTFPPPHPFNVWTAATVTDVPEPSTFVLSGLCLALCGAGWWWKRTRAPLQPASCC
jgi:hypothetical protein